MIRAFERCTAIVTVVVSLGAYHFTNAEPAKVKRDPKAVAVVEALGKAVAPDGAWDKIAGLRFTSVYRQTGEIKNEYRHVWDTRSGRYRLEGRAIDGAERIVLFDVPSRQGEGWVQVTFVLPPEAGHEADTPVQVLRWLHPPGPPQKAYLKFGWQHYIDDTYWLLLPLKVQDPAVELTYEGTEDIEGVTHDVVKTVFDSSLGLTKGTTYWIYVNQNTHLIDRCDYLVPDTLASGSDGASSSPAASSSAAADGSSVSKGGITLKSEPGPAGSHADAKTPPAGPSKGPAPSSPAASTDKSGSTATSDGKTPPVGTPAGAGSASGKPAETPQTIPGPSLKRVTTLWMDWATFGPLHLATIRVVSDGASSITFKDIETFTAIPANIFEPPTKPRVQALATPPATGAQK